jgi:hypothetical protein
MRVRSVFVDFVRIVLMCFGVSRVGDGVLGVRSVRLLEGSLRILCWIFVEFVLPSFHVFHGQQFWLTSNFFTETGWTGLRTTFLFF